MQTSFIHLDIHTEYSISDGLCRIPELVAAVAGHQMPALAVNDKNNLFGAVKFYETTLEAGIKPILGVEVWVPAADHTLGRFILLCRNAQGYRQLTQLLSRGYTQQQPGQASQAVVIQPEWLFEEEGAHVSGLIALSGGYHSDIGQALLVGQAEKAQKIAYEWAQLFSGRFYLTVSRIGREQEEYYIEQLLTLAHVLQLPVAATNEVRFIHAQDFAAHEARVAIHEGFTLEDPKRPRHYTAQQYLRTPKEMQILFADLPEALQNTVEIAKRCNAALTLGINHLPNFPLPQGTTDEIYLSEQAQQGLQQRLTTLSQLESFAGQEVYQQRLQIELDVINPMGFASYFLIVADFIQWAKHQNIPVGPGRGSGAGSLVAYALGITDLDPLQYDLLFERFLNPERVSLPDFDIDFCMERRDEVIDYVAERYGRDKVCRKLLLLVPWQLKQ